MLVESVCVFAGLHTEFRWLATQCDQTVPYGGINILCGCISQTLPVTPAFIWFNSEIQVMFLKVPIYSIAAQMSHQITWKFV